MRRVTSLLQTNGLCVVLALALSSAASGEEMRQMMGGGELKLEPIVVGKPQKIDVQPTSLKLNTPRRRMHLVVTGFYEADRVQDLTRATEFLSSDPKVVKIERGIAIPVGNGRAEIKAVVGGFTHAMPVEVSGQETPENVSFNYGALVALTKHGCSQGACHGSPSGKGGFRLSLRAYDPVLDTETLIRESFNRRTNIMEPAKSLLLRKPIMEVAHGGGRRLAKDDVAYELLLDWIAQGCLVDAPDAAQCIKIDVYPKQRVLHRPAHTQQVLVLASFSDGTVRDVTSLASFSSSDEAVAQVDEDGLVVSVDRGEVAVLARYLEHMATSSMMFIKDIPNFKWNNPPENSFVDKHTFDKLKQLQILPSELCSDEEFVRRVYLDTIGLLPTAADSRAFLADSSKDKRAKLIDQLLERPEYAEFWAMKWADLLRVRNQKMTASGVHKFNRWIVRSLREDLPYDQFARQLLTANGNTFSNPAANFYRTTTDFTDCTETTSQLFLGIRIQCAKCHNHPFERWTQNNYYGIGAFFNRVQRKKTPSADEMVIFVSRQGEVTQPRTGQTMKPWLPLKGDADLPADADRRETFAEWLTTPDNPFFARVAVNRLWGHLMGRGIVEPVDDFRDSNPPSSVALLDGLAKDFVEHNYSIKHSIRTILSSRVYQLSSRKNDFNKDDGKYFSHYRTRMLTAEQLLDAICAVTGVDEKYAGLPAGMHATSLPSPDVDNYFLKVFGQPARETACQCERSSESNLSQALQMINGPLVHGKVRDEKNRFRKLITANGNDEQIVRELYQASFCRQPAAAELAAALKHIQASGDRQRGLEDVCWALLNANEFLFQH